MNVTNLMKEGLERQADSLSSYVEQFKERAFINRSRSGENQLIVEIDTNTLDYHTDFLLYSTTICVYGEWSDGCHASEFHPAEKPGWIVTSIIMFDVEVGHDSDIHDAITKYVDENC